MFQPELMESAKRKEEAFVTNEVMWNCLAYPAAGLPTKKRQFFSKKPDNGLLYLSSLQSGDSIVQKNQKMRIKELCLTLAPNTELAPVDYLQICELGRSLKISLKNPDMTIFEGDIAQLQPKFDRINDTLIRPCVNGKEFSGFDLLKDAPEAGAWLGSQATLLFDINNDTDFKPISIDWYLVLYLMVEMARPANVINK